MKQNIITSPKKIRTMSTEKGIEDYEHIRQYKTKFIYRTPSELNERLSTLEQDTINLLNYYNRVRDNIYNLKLQLKNIEESSNFLFTDHLIIQKEKELSNVKIVHDKHQDLISKLENHGEKMNHKHEMEKSFKIENVYKKINLIFEDSKILAKEIQYSNNIIKFINKSENDKEKEIILKLEYLELCVDYLIKIIYHNKNVDKENIKRINIEIEKEHKIKYSNNQKMLLIEKYKKLEEIIENKKNKIYFLPRRKVAINYMKPKRITINKIIPKKKTFFPNFILFDI